MRQCVSKEVLRLLSLLLESMCWSEVAEIPRQSWAKAHTGIALKLELPRSKNSSQRPRTAFCENSFSYLCRA